MLQLWVLPRWAPLAKVGAECDRRRAACSGLGSCKDSVILALAAETLEDLRSRAAGK